MRELLYLSNAKLAEFLPEKGGGFSGRAVEAEVSALGAERAPGGGWIPTR
ncbi:hypothetical protein [Streptomyces sp. KS 21]|nr:hypothetical protein [Streptomyces sp. KS 21]TDU78239.1 hypothetical protein EDD91_5018 [Streptomyces sp. KS 21]